MDRLLAGLSRLRSYWNTESARLSHELFQRWCGFSVGHDPKILCDPRFARIYTVCQDCGHESAGVVLHTGPVRHVWARERYELWLQYLETLRAPKGNKMRLIKSR